MRERSKSKKVLHRSDVKRLAAWLVLLMILATGGLTVPGARAQSVEEGAAEAFGQTQALETAEPVLLEDGDDGEDKDAPRAPVDFIYDLESARDVDLEALLSAVGLDERQEDVDWVYPMRESSELLMVEESEGVCRIAAVQPFDAARLIVGAEGEHWIVELRNGVPSSGEDEAAGNDTEILIDAYDTPMCANGDDPVTSSKTSEDEEPEEMEAVEVEAPLLEPDEYDLDMEEIIGDDAEDEGLPEEDDVGLEDVEASLADDTAEEMMNVDLGFTSVDDEDGEPVVGVGREDKARTEDAGDEETDGTGESVGIDDEPDDGPSEAEPELEAEIEEEDPDGEEPQAEAEAIDETPATGVEGETAGDDGASGEKETVEDGDGSEGGEGAGDSAASGASQSAGEGETIGDDGASQGGEASGENETVEGGDSSGERENTGDSENAEGDESAESGDGSGDSVDSGAGEGAEGGEGSENSEDTEGTENGEAAEGSEGSEDGESTEGGEGTEGNVDPEGSEDPKGSEGSEDGESTEGGEDTEDGEETEGGEGSENGEGTEAGENAGDGEGSETSEGAEGSENTRDGEPGASGQPGDDAQDAPGVVHAAYIDIEDVPLSLSAMMRRAEAGDPEEEPAIIEEEGQPVNGAPEGNGAADPVLEAEGTEGEAPAADQEDGDSPPADASRESEDGAGEAREDAAQAIAAGDWQIEYDDALLAVEFTGEDYSVMPIAGFDAAVITVRAGDTYVLNLGQWAGQEEVSTEEEEIYPELSFEGQTRYVKVSVAAPEGAFPEGTTMRLRQVYDEDTLGAITDSVEGGKVAVKSVYAVDITFYNAEGEEIEPKAPISVVMSLRKAEESDGAVVVHVDGEGNAEKVDESEDTVSDDTVVGFESNSFSVYALVLTEMLEHTIITSDGETYRITLTCGDDAMIPEGAQLVVREILEDDRDYADYAEQAAEAVRDNPEHLRLFDISIVYEGETIEPAAPVSVRIEYVESVPDSDTLSFDVVHFTEDSPEVILPEVSSAEEDVDTIDFTAESFSVYAVVGTLTKYVLASDGHNYRITVTYRAGAGVPEGAELEAREILAGADADGARYDECLASVEEALGFLAGDAAYLRLFDISIVKDGEKVEIQAPVDVRIELADKDAGEQAEQNTYVVHIPDDSASGDVIDDLNVSGDTVSFTADGFSAYAIVEGPGAIPEGWNRVGSLEELVNRADKGVYIGHVDGYYFTSGITNITSSRTGITKTKPAEIHPGYGAALYRLEQTEDGRFRFYCQDGETRKYIRQKSNSLSLVDADQATAFTVETLGSAFQLKGDGGYYCNMQGGANGASFAAYNSAGDVNNRMAFWYRAEIDEEPYGLDGKTYGLLSWDGTPVGKAMMGEAGPENALAAKPLTVMNRTGDNEDRLFVPKDSSISLWTFAWVGEDAYRLSAQTKAGRQYLKLDGKGLSLVGDPEEASRVRVIPGAGSHAGQICLQADGHTLTYSGAAETGFSVDGSAGNEWLYLTELSELTSEYFMTYSARKVSVSDPVITNGSRIIVYTRAWNDAKKRYEFFTIGPDGALLPCYEKGDSIEWVGGQLNTLLWNFVEYYYEGTDTPNYYYDLYNQYSDSFLAPQVEGGQLLSGQPIGLNLNGRRNNRYYSSILAWDDYYYVYQGLKVEDGRIVSCPQAEAMDFYFAVMEDVPVDDRLTPVKTVDHTQYGITMRMVDFPNRQELSDFLGSDEGGGVTYTQPDLLSTRLGSDGYPTAAGGSLGELYRGAKEVNHLFIDSIFRASGYYEYDSTQNFASLKKAKSGDFTVYKELGSYDSGGNKPTLKHGQFFPFNDLEPGVFASTNGKNLYSATASLLPESDPRKYELLHLVRNVNCFFGAELEASFTQTPDGRDDWGHDIIFEFTGDDDFWLYVDGELVIDLGGIHSALPGTVNFCTGEVNVNGNQTTLRALFEENYRWRNKYATDAEVEAHLDGYFADGGTVFRDYTTHTMKIFYMERGAGASNLHMRFNLASIKPRTVELGKTLSGVDAAESVLAEFPYQIWYMDGSGEERRLVQGDALNRTVLHKGTDNPVRYAESFGIDGATYQDVFLLKPGETAEINFPDGTTAYSVVECGVNTQVYSAVKVNGRAVEGVPVDGLEDREDYAIPYAAMDERSRVIYDNAVNPEALRALTIRKKLFEENGTTEIAEDVAAFSFRLSLATEFEEDLDGSPAGMRPYYVKDPDGCYCRWDATGQRFLSLGKADFEQLSEAERAMARFTTSPNGAISRIPANYTVEVRELLAGARFKVVERPGEIPDGYSFQKYTYGEDSFTDALAGVSDAVVARQDPHVDICNLKGWGLRVNKVWLDADYMAARDDVFFAVYTGASEEALELVPGTVRQMPYGLDTLYWYFLPLPVDVPFEQYEVREVRVENPTVDEDGNVTAWDALEIIPEGGQLRLNGLQKGETEAGSFTYTVAYEKGEVAEGSNVRVDTVKNDRPGITLMKQDMAGNALAGATFALTDNSGNEIGTFTSDEEGRVTVAFLSEDREYFLAETKAPQGYRGLEAPMSLRMKDGEVTVEGVDPALYELDGLTVTVRNRPFALRVVKRDADSGAPLENVKFALHKQYTVDGVTAVEITPLAGFEELLTDAEGIVPRLDETLPAGTYELRELEALPGYQPLPAHILFTIGADGVIALEDAPEGVALEETADEDGSLAVVISVLNSVRKKVGFRKVDGDATEATALEGAVFDLYGVDAVDGQETRQENPLHTGLTSGADGMLADAEGNGAFELPVGIYHLVETQAPNGYNALEVAVRIEVTADGVRYAIGEAEPVAAEALEGQEDVRVVVVPNTKGYAMPSTGGPGTRFHLAAGLTLIALAVLCLLRRRGETLWD